MVMLVENSYRSTFIVVLMFLFNAGWIDSIVLYNVYNESITYVTGNFSSIGNGIAKNDIYFVFNILSLIIGFVIGAMLGGIFLKTENLAFDKAYGRTLLLQAAFTLVGLLLMNQSGYKVYVYYDLFFLSVAMGIQNSLTSIYSGGLARTTHLTGSVTDLGVQIGRMVANKPYDNKKLIFYFSSMVIFTFGATMGTIWSHYSKENYLFLLLPSIIIPFVYGFYYRFASSYSKMKARALLQILKLTIICFIAETIMWH
jgi:uncharacterized membrane protein YoaK (UPF0700 family)